jgi:hypothetical protein
MYRYANFHIPNSSGSLSNQLMKKILRSTKSYLHKQSAFFESLVPYTTSGSQMNSSDLNQPDTHLNSQLLPHSEQTSSSLNWPIVNELQRISVCSEKHARQINEQFLNVEPTGTQSTHSNLISRM